MSDRQPSAAPTRRGKRYPLLFHQALNEQVFWPSIVVLASAAALLVWTPAALASYRAHLSAIFVFTGLLLVLTFVFRLRSFVQCGSDGLHLRLPFYHVLIPYGQMRTVRPDALYRMFPLDLQNWSQRWYLGSLHAEAVVVIEMDRLPSPKRQLRLWMGKYMLSPDRVGLVFAVRDWMALRAELDEFKARSLRGRIHT